MSQCMATTAQGERCKKSAVIDGYCRQHYKLDGKTSSPVSSGRTDNALHDLIRSVQRYKQSTRCMGIQGQNTLWLYYLIRHLHMNSVCLPATANPSIEGYKHWGYLHGLSAISLNDKERSKKQIHVPKSMVAAIQDCKQDLVVLNLFTTDHANVLFINKARRTYERFEPYGNITTQSDKWIEATLDSAQFKKALFGRAKNGYKYEPVEEHCPTFGPQQKQKDARICDDGGYCMTWSLIAIHLRMLTPHEALSTIYEQLNALTAQEALDLVLHYLGWMESVIPDEVQDADAYIKFCLSLLPLSSHSEFLKSRIEVDKFRENVAERKIEREKKLVSKLKEAFSLLYEQLGKNSDSVREHWAITMKYLANGPVNASFYEDSMKQMLDDYIKDISRKI